MPNTLLLSGRPAAGSSPELAPAAPGPADLTPTRHTGWLALLPALAAAVAGFRGLADRQMWNNEYATWHAVTLDLRDLGHLLSNTDLVHVAYLMLLRVWTQVAGDDPLALRLPSLIAMTVAAAMTTLIGRRLAGTGAGLIAGLLFALVPAVTRYAQEARSYALVTMGVTVSTLLLLRALQRPVRRRWLLYALAVALTGWLHFVSLLVLAAHLLIVWRATADADDNRRYQWFGYVGGAGLAIVPLLTVASAQSASISWIKADGAAVLHFPGDLFLSVRGMAAVVGLAAVGALVAWRTGNRMLPALLTWVLLPPVFAYLTFKALHLFLPRYVLFTLPAWAILAAVGACSVTRLLPRSTAAWSWLLPALLVLPAFAYLTEPDQRIVRASPVQGQPDYRGAIDAMRQGMKPGDGVAYNDVFGQLSDLAREAVDYEMRNDTQPRDVFLNETSVARGSYSASECEDKDSAACLRDTERIWLICTNYSPDPFDGLSPQRAALLRGFAVVEEKKFDRVRLVLLERKPA
ncbi:glycosyltransferase family 39 protein [Micromonospora sp. HK10]|uniref:glycosyltransferase family 39 protein n=1 Tax=Micromonospora sp. HK10 TaxID=1538294 RepID=UPI000695AEBB|nr:glycosyltransferase family 39 protein [Micromonospora sp. HK10]